MRIALLLALAALPAAPAFAAWPNNPGTNLPVAIASFTQQQVVSVSDGAGGVILAWSDFRNGLDDDVFVQRISASGSPLWTAGGVNLTGLVPNNQNVPAICSDGAGGAIIAWIDARTFGSSLNDIYVQRINANGVAQWTAGGVALCTQSAEQQFPAICGDGAGGAVVGWADFRNANADVFARRVSAAGTPQGAANGVAVCAATGSQADVRMVSDSQGGGILTWNDYRSADGDIYAQRFLSLGFVDPAWPANGRALCTATNSQYDPRIASDGAGGAIVAWSDLRGGSSDIYAQRVQSNGVVDLGWAANGSPVCTATGVQTIGSIVSDGMGGAIIAWADSRSGSSVDLYAMRMTPSGVADPSWPLNGLPVSVAGGNQWASTLAEDGANGAFAVWVDMRASLAGDLYAHHILISGTVDPAWPVSGRPVSIAAGGQFPLNAVSDGNGGLITAWTDDRSGNGDIYAQRVARFGALGSPEPHIHNVRDVPNDQGGRVNVTWQASYLDTDPSAQVTQYWVLRSLTSSASKAHEGPAPVALAELTPDAVERMGAGATLTTEAAAVTYYWELIGNVSALHLVSGYGFLASTTGDSTAAYNPRTHFMVVAWNNAATQYWASAPDSGYSADNLPPETPALFAGQYSGGSTALHWIPNTEADFAHYRLYRGTSPGFVPDAANRIASPSDTGHVDAGGLPYFYKLSAVDAHGNESGYALLSPNGTLDSDGPVMPARLSLSRPSPNPARGALTLRFALPRESHVRLTLHDASGRLVRTLADGVHQAAEHSTTWDGRDERGIQAPGGLYFARLEADGHSDVARLTWLR